MVRASAQSAMEYLMTYGWAIIVILVVLAALYTIGVFTPGANFGNSCGGNFKFSCGTLVLATNGSLSFVFGQNTGAIIYNLAFACTASKNSTGGPLAGTSPWYYVSSNGRLSTSYSTSSFSLESGRTLAVSGVYCYDQNSMILEQVGLHKSGIMEFSGLNVGQRFSGILWVRYTNRPGPENSAANPWVQQQAGSIEVQAGATGATIPASTTTVGGSTSTSTTSATSTTTGSTTASTSATTTISWSAAENYPITISTPGCVVANGYIYCVGGSGAEPVGSANYTNRTVFASVSTDVPVGWSGTTPFPLVSAPYVPCVTDNNYIYCIAGNGSAYSAPISSNGIGGWTATTNYPTLLFNAQCITAGGYIYCIGGLNVSNNYGYTDIYSAPISGGNIGTWTLTTSYPVNITYPACATDGSYIYCAGGSTGNGGMTLGNVYSAQIVSGGKLGTWSADTYLPSATYKAYCDMYNGNLFCLDEESGAYYEATPSSGVFNSPWTQIGTYPTVSSSFTPCSIIGGTVSCIGGFNSPPPYTTNAIYYANLP